MDLYGSLRRNRRIRSAYHTAKNRVPARFVYGPQYFTVRDLLERRDTGADVAAELDARLASVLRTALTRVPYYRELGLDIQADEIGPDTAREALTRFPYLEKRTVMQAPESFVSEAYDVSRLTKATSGGSTGQGIKLFRGAPDEAAETGFIFHEWGKHGYTRTSKVVRMGADAKKREDEPPCERDGDRLLVSPYHFNERWVATIYEEVRAFSPGFFHAYPSCFEYLVDYMHRAGLTLPSVSAIFLASERVTPRQLELASMVFSDAPVVFFYGLSERTNIAWGSWTGGEISYRFDEAYGHTENLVHENGAYEIVGTSYWNEVMPLIRYRTQDFGQIVDGAMGNLEGREQEFLLTKQGTRIPGLSLVIDQFTWDFVEVFQVAQHEPGRLEFRIKPRSTYTAEVGERILASQRAKWGNFFELELVVTDDIERTPSGKIRHFVIDLP